MAAGGGGKIGIGSGRAALARCSFLAVGRLCTGARAADNCPDDICPSASGCVSASAARCSGSGSLSIAAAARWRASCSARKAASVSCSARSSRIFASPAGAAWTAVVRAGDGICKRAAAITALAAAVNRAGFDKHALTAIGTDVSDAGRAPESKLQLFNMAVLRCDRAANAAKARPFRIGLAAEAAAHLSGDCRKAYNFRTPRHRSPSAYRRGSNPSPDDSRAERACSRPPCMRSAADSHRRHGPRDDGGDALRHSRAASER